MLPVLHQFSAIPLASNEIYPIIQIAIMLSIISSHFIMPFLAFSPEKTPNNGKRNIEIINGLPNVPNDTPPNIV